MLTDSQIKKIKPPVGKTAPDKYSDGNNLYLHVFSTGSKRWIMDYRFEGKRKAYSIGIYPDVSLADARGKRDEARKLLTQGVDPMQMKKLKRQDDLGHDSFKHVALAWFTKKSPTWSESNSKKVMRRLEVDIFPYLGSSKISEIHAPELLKTIQRIETRSVDTAYRALQECGQVFRYGMAIGSNIHDPSVALKGALTTQDKKHYAAIIEPEAVGELMRAIKGFNGSFVVKCALQLAPMFFVRIGELRKAKWSEMDLESGEWRYFITKTKQDHIVTLSRQAIAILKDLQQLTGQYEHVFIGGRDPKRPMSDAAINAALRRMGYDTKTEMTGHGFRAMARTILHERLGIDRDVIEHQLAHRVGDTLGTAYNRTKFLDQRKVMMQAWADYLDELRGGQVIPFPKVAG
jgi:integrase